jgi:hypothetical protein
VYNLLYSHRTTELKCAVPVVTVTVEVLNRLSRPFCVSRDDNGERREASVSGLGSSLPLPVRVLRGMTGARAKDAARLGSARLGSARPRAAIRSPQERFDGADNARRHTLHNVADGRDGRRKRLETRLLLGWGGGQAFRQEGHVRAPSGCASHDGAWVANSRRCRCRVVAAAAETAPTTTTTPTASTNGVQSGGNSSTGMTAAAAGAHARRRATRSNGRSHCARPREDAQLRCSTPPVSSESLAWPPVFNTCS